MDGYKDHPVLKLPVFQTDKFKAFAIEVNNVVNK
jgi:hypothetical protein